jgi:ribonuclease HI
VPVELPLYYVYSDASTPARYRVRPITREKVKNPDGVIGFLVRTVGAGLGRGLIHTQSIGIDGKHTTSELEMMAVHAAGQWLVANRPPAAVIFHCDDNMIVRCLNTKFPKRNRTRWHADFDKMTAIMDGWAWRVDRIRRSQNGSAHILCRRHVSALSATDSTSEINGTNTLIESAVRLSRTGPNGQGIALKCLLAVAEQWGGLPPSTLKILTTECGSHPLTQDILTLVEKSNISDLTV